MASTYILLQNDLLEGSKSSCSRHQLVSVMQAVLLAGFRPEEVAMVSFDF